ncbi:MAG: hypothetical protein VYA30_16875 [Myxococcota bacterium]|nr:hypothetical protein [Myxococcota bacterium]
MKASFIRGLRGLAVSLFFWTGTAQSTVVEPLSIGQLAAESHRVVRGYVDSVYVVPERGERGEIYTRVELTVDEYIIGDGPDHLTVQQLGGQLGEWQMYLSGNAEFIPGTEVIVFLDYEPAKNLHYVVGLAQGLFIIDRTGDVPSLSRDLDGLSFYLAEPVPFKPGYVEDDLETLLTALSPQGPAAEPVNRGVIQ